MNEHELYYHSGKNLYTDMSAKMKLGTGGEYVQNCKGQMF